MPNVGVGTGQRGSLKKRKWQYHKNPEAGSTDHQDRADFKNQAVADFKSQAVADLTGEVLTGADLFPAKKLNIELIIS